jgi:hypothetical protein
MAPGPVALVGLSLGKIAVGAPRSGQSSRLAGGDQRAALPGAGSVIPTSSASATAGAARSLDVSIGGAATPGGDQAARASRRKLTVRSHEMSACSLS